MNFNDYIVTLKNNNLCDTVDFNSLDIKHSDIPSFLYFYENEYNKSVHITNISDFMPSVMGNVYSSIDRLLLSLNLPLDDQNPIAPSTNAEGSSGDLGGFGLNKAFTHNNRERYTINRIKHKLISNINVINKTKTVSNAPCKDNFISSSDADIRNICVPIHYCEGDGGPFITSGVIVTRSPQTGHVNYAIRRHQIHSSTELGAYINFKSDTMKHLKHAREMGQKLQAAIIIGASPAVFLSACMYVPPEIGESSLAGNLLGHPLEVIQCNTVDLQVPACSQIVLEGYIDPDELREEGPMIEYSDCTVGIRKQNVFHLTGIMHKNSPVYHALRSGRSAEHDMLQIITQWSRALMLKNILNGIFNDLINEVAFYAGSAASHVVIQLKEPSKKQGKKILKWVLKNYIVKIATVIDCTVSPFNQEEIAWATFVFAGSTDDYLKYESEFTTSVDPTSHYESAYHRYHVCKIGINAVSDFTFKKPTPPFWSAKKADYFREHLHN